MSFQDACRCSGSGVGDEIHGGSGVQELVPMRQGHTAGTVRPVWAMGPFCGFSVAQARVRAVAGAGFGWHVPWGTQIWSVEQHWAMGTVPQGTR